MNQGLASPSGVMHKLEKAQVKRQLLLRDATMRAQPGTFQSVDMDFMKPIAIFIACTLRVARGVIDALMLITPIRTNGYRCRTRQCRSGCRVQWSR